MDETTLKMAIAAFFHDIGKVMGMRLLGMNRADFDAKAADFLPVYQGRYSHHHALYTAEFIDAYHHLLPDEFSRPWGEGDGLVKLAASHHNPSSPLEWIIAEADRISSGMDRQEFNAYLNETISYSDFEKTRLLPIFESLDDDGNADFSTRDQYRFALPLEEMTPASIFPKPVKTVVPADKKAAKSEYAALFNGFTSSLKLLLHRNHIQLWFEHFDGLAMRFWSHVPAARVGNVIPDVSLYDHLKTTSALAAAMYLFHKTDDSLTVDAVKQTDTAKFMLVSGDFHGIQHFIFSGYGDTRKFRSKLMRGRSFYVSILSEMAAHLLCDRIGLPHVAVVLNAGGKFTLIAPWTTPARQAVQQVQETLDQWFADLTYCETGISLSTVSATADDFKSGHFQKLQDRFAQEMAAKKYDRVNMDRFGGVVADYFDAENAAVCPFCGKRPALENVNLNDGQKACRLCRDHVFLGEQLVKRSEFAVLKKDAMTGETTTEEAIFKEFQCVFPEDGLEKSAANGDLLHFWQIKLPEGDDLKTRAALRFFSGYIPVYTQADEQDPRLGLLKKDHEKEMHAGEPKTLNHIAAAALNLNADDKTTGVAALGVLKADVDNLGLLMACGLRERMHSISRMATLSRQLNSFFALYLPHFLANEPMFANTYTVFAGGDDLMLIGPWNRMVALAPIIAQKFSQFSCNPRVHLSAGISLHKAHTPMDVLARQSETALETSKTSGRNRLTLFGQTAAWAEMEELAAIKATMTGWLDEKIMSEAMFYRLNHLIDMADKEKRAVDRKSIHISRMACTRWRSMLTYAVERNVGRWLPSGNEKEKKIEEVRELLARWISEFEGRLQIPLWDIQYNRR